MDSFTVKIAKITFLKNPDPNDCTRYRQCDDVGILTNYYQCPSGYNFNSQNGLCDKTATCDVIDCSASKDKAITTAVTFKLNPRFYAFCHTSTSGRIESAIYKCSANLIFSLKANTCIYQCASEGVFKDLTNCHAYFLCSGSARNFKWVRKVCPAKYFFDGEECVMEHSPCSSANADLVIQDVQGATSLQYFFYFQHLHFYCIRYRDNFNT